MPGRQELSTAVLPTWQMLLYACDGFLAGRHACQTHRPATEVYFYRREALIEQIRIRFGCRRDDGSLDAHADHLLDDAKEWRRPAAPDQYVASRRKHCTPLSHASCKPPPGKPPAANHPTPEQGGVALATAMARAFIDLCLLSSTPVHAIPTAELDAEAVLGGGGKLDCPRAGCASHKDHCHGHAPTVIPSSAARTFRSKSPRSSWGALLLRASHPKAR